MRTLFFTTNNYSPLVIRLLLSVVLFAHGAQKLLGWFSGYGFEGTMNYFVGTVGLPWVVGFLVIMIEFFAPIALVLGFATRLWSIAIILLVIGIIFSTHSDYFFMNWFGNQKAEGFEYFLLMLGMSLSLVLSGAGKFSLDVLLSKRFK